MPQRKPPRCQAPHEEHGRPCGHEMRPLQERHPSFGPNYRPGGWVFTCPYCSAVRFIADEQAAAQTEAYR
jgi:hypothetical protein